MGPLSGVCNDVLCEEARVEHARELRARRAQLEAERDAAIASAAAMRMALAAVTRKIHIESDRDRSPCFLCNGYEECEPGCALGAVQRELAASEVARAKAEAERDNLKDSFSVASSAWKDWQEYGKKTTAERDAAIARAEKAEAELYDAERLIEEMSYGEDL